MNIWFLFITLVAFVTSAPQSQTTTSKIVSGLYRTGRDSHYPLNRYGSGDSIKSLPEYDVLSVSGAPDSKDEHLVERRCLRCADPVGAAAGYPVDNRYNDDRRSWQSGRYDDRRGGSDRYDRYDRYDYRRPSEYGDYDRSNRWDDRYGMDMRGAPPSSGHRTGYDRYRPEYDERDMKRPSYDRYDRYDDRYDNRTPYDPYRDQPMDYDRYDSRRDPYDSRRPSYDMWNRGSGGYDRYDSRGGYDRYDTRGGYEHGYRPWDETTRGQSGWDSNGKGYYFATGGRPEPSGYWGGGSDSKYATGWNYGSGNRDDGWNRDPGWKEPSGGAPPRDGQQPYRPRDPPSYYDRDRGSGSAASSGTGSGSGSGGGYRGTSYLYDRGGPGAQPTSSTTLRNENENTATDSPNAADKINSNNVNDSNDSNKG